MIYRGRKASCYQEAYERASPVIHPEKEEVRMQGFLKSLSVALVLSCVTPTFLCAATTAKGVACAAQAQQERALVQKAEAQRQAGLAEKRAIVRQMLGNGNPALRKQLIQQQMKGGK
jgi:hypothetical protein